MQVDTRYELYKDLCFSRSTSPSKLGYTSTINSWSQDFENEMLRPSIGNQNEFDDYIEYKVLSEIAKKYASERNSYGELESTMSYYLQKYNIKDFKNNKILDTSMYNRIKNVYDRELHKKIIYRYDEMLEKVPEQYKSKYKYILDFDGDKSDFENFYNLDKKLVILKSIEKLENLDSKVKVLVHWSEDNAFGTTTAGTNGDDPKVYTIKEMDNLVNRVYERNKKYDYGYIKTKFSIIVDDGEDVIVSVTDRIDIGDPCTDTFTNFMKRYYGQEYVESLSKFDNYLESQCELQESEVR